DLGVGVGSLQVENDALGVVDYDRRGAYTNESLEVMIAAWTQTELAYSGEFFSFADAKASPKPLQRPHVPIHVGGNRPPALRRVAAYGQGWHPLGVSPEGLVERKARLVDELEARGRSIDEIHISIRADVDLRESPPGPDERPAPFRGTVEQLRESISRFAEAGAHEIVVSVGSPELARSVEVLERFADEVIPAFTS
ncbi:MAG: LLM class flavin-dependent oxidoreductase, partial [Acidimicrobiia bacterium]|nr:LLM class flavin-dependent oxidoreductase [Acidimicrobiia bacterium]